MEKIINKIECQYGHHLCNYEEFTESGLNSKYYKICRKCKAEKERQYRKKHNEEFNNKRRDAHREYMRKWREKNNKEICT